MNFAHARGRSRTRILGQVPRGTCHPASQVIEGPAHEGGRNWTSQPQHTPKSVCGGQSRPSLRFSPRAKPRPDPVTSPDPPGLVRFTESNNPSRASLAARSSGWRVRPAPAAEAVGAAVGPEWLTAGSAPLPRSPSWHQFPPGTPQADLNSEDSRDRDTQFSRFNPLQTSRADPSALGESLLRPPPGAPFPAHVRAKGFQSYRFFAVQCHPASCRHPGPKSNVVLHRKRNRLHHAPLPV